MMPMPSGMKGRIELERSPQIIQDGYAGIGGGEGMIYPTTRVTHPPVQDASEPQHIYLADDDDKIEHYFDQYHAMTDYNDVGERVFWLPANPKKNQTIWITSTMGADLMFRMTAYNHALVSPLIYGLWVADFGIPTEICSTWLDIGREAFVRCEFRIATVAPNAAGMLRTLVFRYTGLTISRPVNYIDADSDGYYMNPGVGIPEHPLIYGTFYLWSLIVARHVSLYTNAYCVWTQSPFGPYG